MYFPGICPQCQHKGLEAHLARPMDYLECDDCGWRSDRPALRIVSDSQPVEVAAQAS